MYVAVIAENIADRKHMERLLDRVSDAIMATAGNLYIESFGDAASIGPVAHRYSMFFLDFQSDMQLMREIMDKLTDCSIPSNKIIICQPEESTAMLPEFSEEYLTVQKPLRMEQLIQVALKIYQQELDAKVPTMEIRSEEQTTYIPISTIVYAEEEGHQVHIHLMDGNGIFMLGNIVDFAREVDFCGDFITYKKGFSYNKAFEKSKSSGKVTLTTGKTFPLSFFDKRLL
ncbi:MAG: hypothetical protein HDR01_15445 [Lachnospiraceae bacterium]|nr:hypothetical protein [Lachnospiraceae bacterium]